MSQTAKRPIKPRIQVTSADDALKDAVAKRAAAEGRSVANLVRHILNKEFGIRHAGTVAREIADGLEVEK